MNTHYLTTSHKKSLVLKEFVLQSNNQEVTQVSLEKKMAAMHTPYPLKFEYEGKNMRPLGVFFFLFLMFLSLSKTK